MLCIGCGKNTVSSPDTLSSSGNLGDTENSSDSHNSTNDSSPEGTDKQNSSPGKNNSSNDTSTNPNSSDANSTDTPSENPAPNEPETEGSITFDETKLEENEGALEDVPAPILTTATGEKLALPLPKIFDYGTSNEILLDDFNDGDHQNNLAAALATYNGQNYTTGGGYWYVFQSKSSSVTNSSGLDINAYNVLEAIEDGHLHLSIKAGDFAGVGTNILYEESPQDLTGLTAIRMRLKGSGTLTCYLEQHEDQSVEENPDNWGKYGTTITLENDWKTYTIPVSKFKGDEHSQISNKPLSSQIHEISKFLFQIKDGKSAEIYIDEVVFEGLTIEDLNWTGVRDPSFTFDPDAPALNNSYKEYLDFDNLPSTDFPTNIGTDTPDLAETGKPNFLHVEGNSLYDSKSNRVRLTGINWFGIETKTKMFHGLWSRDYKSMLQQVKDLGFNCVRIPWSNESLTQDDPDELDIEFTGSDPYTGEGNMNSALKNKNSLEIMTIVVEEAQALGLKVILDNHSKVSDGYITEGLWYTDVVSEAKWIEDWEFVANHFKEYDAVIAMDLKNEPHFDASWGTGDSKTDWNTAAEKCGNAILAQHPDVLIMVAGVEATNGKASYSKERYWWGGNLQGVRTNPITLTDNSKLVYTPHEYGPEVHLQDWFKDPRFPTNLEHLWNDRFGFVSNEEIGHLFIGEFGIKEKAEGTVSSVWFDKFIEYITERSDGISFTFWAWNPNSGDTGGILQHDWNDINDWKLKKLEPILAPLIGNNNGI